MYRMSSRRGNRGDNRRGVLDGIEWLCEEGDWKVLKGYMVKMCVLRWSTRGYRETLCIDWAWLYWELLCLKKYTYGEHVPVLYCGRETLIGYVHLHRCLNDLVVFFDETWKWIIAQNWLNDRVYRLLWVVLWVMFWQSKYMVWLIISVMIRGVRRRDQKQAYLLDLIVPLNSLYYVVLSIPL